MVLQAREIGRVCRRDWSRDQYRYRQEGALSWGYLTPPDETVSDHVRLTQRLKPKPSA